MLSITIENQETFGSLIKNLKKHVQKSWSKTLSTIDSI